MTEKTLIELEELRSKTDYMIALAGNCNVGKSTIFNNLTGLGVMTAHYAGKTVELNLGLSRIDGIPIGIVDLPGIYSLGCISDDQYVARQTLLEYKFDAVVYVLDATNLSRNLYTLIQLIDLEFPVIAALNLGDEAYLKGITTDEKKLEGILGIKVIPTSAIRGSGLKELIHEATDVKFHQEAKCRETECQETQFHQGTHCHEGTHYLREYHYGSDIEREVKKVTDALDRYHVNFGFPISHRACALLLLERDPQFIDLLDQDLNRNEIRSILEKSWKFISDSHGEEAPLRIARERHGMAGSITDAVQSKKIVKERLSEKFMRLSTNPVTGLPIFMIVFAVMMGILFAGGNWLSDILARLWSQWCSLPIGGLIEMIAGTSIWAKVLKWGFDDGMLAALSVGIPYVFVFYLLLSFLEDTGYLNAAAFLLDRALHAIGLHGRAFMPLAAAIGCNVPAIIGTKILNTLRERIIAIFLIVLLSCSARTAVIIGAVSRFLGWFWAVMIILIDISVVICAGMLMNRYVKGDSEGMVMEFFSMRTPDPKTVLKKTWVRFADFVWIATPIVLAGSMLLGYLYETRLIWSLVRPLSPVVEGWLGLPSFAGLTLIFAVLRKELALNFLVTLAVAQQGHSINSLLAIMTKEQIFTFTLFNTLYLPCLATISVIKREIGLKWTFVILGSTLATALLLTGIIHQLLLFTHLPG